MNNLDQQDLWNKIASLQIGSPDASFTFNKRLARENRWSIAFADKVVFEYKRFIFLAAISKEEVTPSDQVDQAWHLHLTYTKSYWKDLCEGLLGFELHHNPTLGGSEEPAIPALSVSTNTDWLSATLLGVRPNPTLSRY